jgi:hypothetical protein
MAKAIQAICYQGLNRAIQDSQATHGKTPWVVFVSSSEIGWRSSHFYNPDLLQKAFKINPREMLSINCFDGDPFDYPDAELFNQSKAKLIMNFLSQGFWPSDKDLIVTCPTGIKISPSISTAVFQKAPTPVSLKLHPTKKPKLSNQIIGCF